jgi:hypothetical protein
MKNDRKLADEIERYLAPDATYHHWDPSMEDMEQIVAALRRWAERICPRCKGSGEAKGMTYGHGPDDYEIDIPCPDCNGTGERQPSGEMVMVTEFMKPIMRHALETGDGKLLVLLQKTYDGMLSAAKAEGRPK